MRLVTVRCHDDMEALCIQKKDALCLESESSPSPVVSGTIPLGDAGLTQQALAPGQLPVMLSWAWKVRWIKSVSSLCYFLFVMDL